MSGEIILKKDEDFDILCFDISFDGFLSTRVRLCPINSPSTPLEKGSKFAQIVFQKVANHPVLREVENFEDNSQRGEGPFGSTGLKYVCKQDLLK